MTMMMRRIKPTHGMLVLFAVTSVFTAASIGAAERKVDAGPEVRVRTVTTLEPLAGRLSRLSLQSEAVLLAGDDAMNIPARDLISIEVIAPEKAPSPSTSAPDPQSRDAVRVRLANGDLLAGRLAKGSPDSLALETATLGRMTVLLEQIESIGFAPAVGPAHADSSRWFDKGPMAGDDGLLLTNGDVVRGFITAIDGDGITMDQANTPTTIPLRLAVAARFVHPPVEPPIGQFAVATFRDGSRLTLVSLEWTDRKIVAKTSSEAEIDINVDCLATVTMAGGRWKWLSEMSPISSEHTPMLAIDWDYKKDRNVLNAPLTVAGRMFDHGIGVHSRSRLIFELKGEYAEFVTSLAMDDDSGPAADVSVQILVDGKPRFQQAGLRQGRLHGPVRVDVANAGRIELVVDYGENGGIQDRFDWIEPGLILP